MLPHIETVLVGKGESIERPNYSGVNAVEDEDDEEDDGEDEEDDGEDEEEVNEDVKVEGKKNFEETSEDE